MNREILKSHISAFLADSEQKEGQFKKDYEERLKLVSFYQAFTKQRILSMSEEDLYDYISPLWAMLIWGNKHYVVDKLLENNSLDGFRANLAGLLHGPEPIAQRWDRFRINIKGMGPAMISEVLCKTFTENYMIWNRRAFVGLNYLEVEGLPRYDYQLTGEVYEKLCDVAQGIAGELEKAGLEDHSLLAVDYFLWHQLQVEDNLSKIHMGKTGPTEVVQEAALSSNEFVHNDIRDKLRDIGQWLGFESRIEQRVSEGARVDTIWEATIGNMGRVIYVFEVQTRGSIDSLIVNLLKALNNPAVQGVVAVSDSQQLVKIKGHAEDVKELRGKLKYWDYEEVTQIHESLSFVYESINTLGLVPRGF